MELRRSCKFVLPKEMSPFFLLAGDNIIEKHISANPVCGTNIRAPELAVKGAPGRKCCLLYTSDAADEL